MCIEEFIIKYNEYWKEGGSSTAQLAKRLGMSVGTCYNLIHQVRQVERFTGARILVGKLSKKSQLEKQKWL
jgi:transposase